ncbi:MAG: hypothetical protein AAFQ41_05270 [Cyanobacteria bacterium J06623_7]
MSRKFLKKAAIGCATAFGILFATSFLGLVYWLWSGMKEQEQIAADINIRIDSPPEVSQYEEFAIDIYLENTSANPYKLSDIDVPPEYFEEVNIFDAQPPFHDRFVGVATGQMNYKFKVDIPPQQTTKVTLLAISENPGTYREFISVCINTSSTCIGNTIRTEVVTEKSQ